MSKSAPALSLMVVVAAVLWHVLSVLAPPQQAPPPDTAGRDFASYYYASRVATRGGDPYDKAELEKLAQADGTRSSVHPYFYPPPFLLLVAWAPATDLMSGFRMWFLLNELCLLASCLVLWRWWAPLGPAVAPALAATVALTTGIAYGDQLGQANFPVLALLVTGLWQERKRPFVAGALVGAAAMLKMAPALVVAWWLLRRQWRAAGAGVATAGVLTLVALPLVGFDDQWRFYTRILPQFASGDYNGLVIRIDMFGNHSIPNLFHQAFPSGGNHLSSLARVLSGATSLALVGGLGWAFHRPTADRVQLAAQAAAVLLTMLLVPVYTYEHHLVFALPAVILAIVAVHREWLGARWGVAIRAAAALLAFQLPALKQLSVQVITEANALTYWVVQELKFGALLVVLAAVATVGATRSSDVTRAPPPSG